MLTCFEDLFFSLDSNSFELDFLSLMGDTFLTGVVPLLAELLLTLLLVSGLLILNLDRPENFFRKGFGVTGDLELV